MKIGDKVYVSDWMKRYSKFYWWQDAKRVLVFDWKTEIPQYCEIDFFHERKYAPKLTQKGVPYKNGEKVLVSDTPVYENYEYTILEKIKHPSSGENICLIASENGCYVQINEKGLSTLTPEEQQKVAHLESEKRLQALAKDNLGKWSINNNLKEFPKELVKVLYDKEQRTQFGRGFTKAIITHRYIPKEYTIKGNDLYLGWSQLFNGEGCSLEGKETISWDELKERFPDSNFTM